MEYGNAKSPHKEKLQCKPKGTYAIAKYKATKYLQEIGKKKISHLLSFAYIKCMVLTSLKID